MWGQQKRGVDVGPQTYMPTCFTELNALTQSMKEDVKTVFFMSIARTEMRRITTAVGSIQQVVSK